jgi:DNA-binding response OmpR family regulator
MKTILCIEDNEDYQLLIRKALKDYRVVSALSIEQAKQKLLAERPEIILLDVALPDGDGFHFFSLLKEDSKNSSIPVIFLSAAAEVSNKVMAFNLGAEDYITKPVDPVELKARVAARLRSSSHQEETLRFGDLALSISQQRLLIGETSIDLTSKEFRLLRLFLAGPEKIYSRNEILQSIWGTDTHVVDRTIDTHISNLRKKIQPSQIAIESIAGEGYRLKRIK